MTLRCVAHFFRKLGFDVMEHDGSAVMRHGGADIRLQSTKRRRGPLKNVQFSTLQGSC
jgi:hypothetical protein